MENDEFEHLRAVIDSADGSQQDLGRVFADAADRLGHRRASALWWAAFGAHDASET